MQLHNFLIDVDTKIVINKSFVLKKSVNSCRCVQIMCLCSGKSTGCEKNKVWKVQDTKVVGIKVFENF